MNFETTEDRIVSALGWISLEHDVSIIYACESGSRAWGFASKDSDYDVRFVYAHHRDWYTSVDSCSKRDVIDSVDLRFNEPLDIAGWDIRKALQLFRKGNPPFLEWIHSPIRYVDRYNFGRDISRLAEAHLNKSTIVMHYVHMAFGNWRKYLTSPGDVLLKKYLYVVRPLCAAVYLTEMQLDVMAVPTPLVPPVEFEVLLKTVEHLLPPGVGGAIQILIETKRSGMELGTGPRIEVLDEWIKELVAAWDGASTGRPTLTVPIEELNELFREMLEATI